MAFNNTTRRTIILKKVRQPKPLIFQVNKLFENINKKTKNNNEQIGVILLLFFVLLSAPKFINKNFRVPDE